MPNSVLVQIADAVVTELNSATLSQTFTAVRARVPEYDTATTTTLKVFVFGLTEAVSQISRADFDHTYGVKVAIYKQVADDTEADAIDYFRQQVIDLLKSKERLTNYPDARSTGEFTNDPAYDPASMDKGKTFVSVIGATYRLPR